MEMGVEAEFLNITPVTHTLSEPDIEILIEFLLHFTHLLTPYCYRSSLKNL